MFVDEIKVFARAGHGGKGCIAFLRETSRPKGGPSGGNGGGGGDVILQADHDLNNLVAQFFNPRLIAPNGEPGLGKGMDGHAGQDLIVKVPCGTLVWRLEPLEPAPEQGQSDEVAGTLPPSWRDRPMIRHAGTERAVELNPVEEPAGPAVQAAKGELAADMTEPGQRFVLCKGGRGGLGNRNFATARHQTPRFAQPGEPGLEGEFLLELRIMAEVGLVGFPNAGKSTLLTAISKARPKVAPYPFTTLHPQIGILEYGDFHRMAVCDVPGLIEGAHNNAGLGHKFLRHIERCKLLVVVVDMAGTEGRKPYDDYKKLMDELKLYDPALLEKPRLLAANKMDEPAAAGNLKNFKAKVRHIRIVPMAAAFDQGIEPFKAALRDMCEER